MESFTLWARFSLRSAGQDVVIFFFSWGLLGIEVEVLSVSYSQWLLVSIYWRFWCLWILTSIVMKPSPISWEVSSANFSLSRWIHWCPTECVIEHINKLTLTFCNHTWQNTMTPKETPLLVQRHLCSDTTAQMSHSLRRRMGQAGSWAL